MNQLNLDKFKKHFEAELVRLEMPLQQWTLLFGIKSDDLKDEGDLTTSENSRQIDMRLKSRDALYLEKVRQSLKRISNKTFGECKCCGGEVGLARLEARPTSELCLECKEESELAENQHADGRRSKSLAMRLRFAPA